MYKRINEIMRSLTGFYSPYTPSLMLVFLLRAETNTLYNAYEELVVYTTLPENQIVLFI